MNAATPNAPWILLRGLTREAGHWGPFLRRFGEAAAPRAVLAVDLPGNGALHNERSPADVPALRDHVRAQLAQRGMAPPYRVLALSLGAMVAVDWAQRHPQELECAVLVNTSLRPFSPFHHRLRPGNYAALLRLVPGGTPRQWEETVLRLTSNKVKGPAADALVAQWLALRDKNPVSRGNALRQLLAAARYAGPASAPAVPLLLLNGEGDRLVSPACSVALARQWGCDLRCHPQAGHDLPLDDGDWVARAVAQWLAARRLGDPGRESV